MIERVKWMSMRVKCVIAESVRDISCVAMLCY